MSMEVIGGFLKGAREGRGLSPAEVAAALKQRLGRNVDTTTLWRIETARMTPGSDLLMALLGVLRVSADAMIGVSERDGATPADGEAAGRLAVSDSDELSRHLIEKMRRLPSEEKAAWEQLLESRLRQLDG
jgi:transcriptional regulator with XRE-family HTH domain